MDYNMTADLLIMGGSVGALALWVYAMSLPPKPYKKVHMVDQAKRWGK